MYIERCLGKTPLEGFRELKRLFPSQLANTEAEELTKSKTAAYLDLLNGHDVLYPSVVKTLTALEKDFKFGLVSSGVREGAETILDKSGIRKLFDVVVTGEDVEEGKPDPEGYLLGLEALKLKKNKVVVVEDAPSGIEAAITADLKCIAVEQTTPRNQLFEADFIIDKINQLDKATVDYVLSSKHNTRAA